MYRVGLIAFAATLAASPATAGGAGSPVHDLMDLATRAPPVMQARATALTPRVSLPAAAETWVREEVARQAASPRNVAQVSLAIDEALEDDIRRMAREQRVDGFDVSMAILLQVMYGAREVVQREVKDRDDEAAAERLALAEANFEAVLPLQSQTSLYLATRKGE